MRASGVRGILIYCSDYHCSHSVAVNADLWANHTRLPDIEDQFVCQSCGSRAADVRPDFDRERNVMERCAKFTPYCRSGWVQF